MRTIELDKAVLDVFADIRERQRLEAKRIGEAWDNPSGFIFTRENGLPVLGFHAHKAFRRSLKLAGIWDGVSKSAGYAYIHHLRHTFGYDQLNNGTPMLHVSRLMGHSSVSFTMEVYGHISRATELEAAKLSSKLLEDANREAELIRLLEPVNA